MKVNSNYGTKVCDIIICGPDEKVIRLYEPPASFLNMINKRCDTKLHLYFDSELQEG